MDASVELVRCLRESIVSLRVQVPLKHPSTRILGNERMGSGVVVDASGLVLTVNYVVMGASTVEVSFMKGRRGKGEIVAQDFDVGLALVRVKRQGLTAAACGVDREVDRGEPVVAIAAGGPQERPTAGGLLTYLGEFEAYWEYLLERGFVSNAPNPGYGGGGLFTLGGRLLGVIYLNLAEIGRSSLSIPIDLYRAHEEEMLRYGRVVSRPTRAWLGVFAHAIEDGVVVAGIVPDGPGHRGGLEEGDLIVSLNSEEVASRRELYMSLWRHAPGEKLTLEVMRDSRVRRLEVTGGDRAHFFRQT
jgi:S1-C subfamily serine protease